jgi:DNA repair exonuclease SbcCD ATPase subunit
LDISTHQFDTNMARTPAKGKATEAQRATKVLKALDDLQSGHEMTIIRVSEPISSALQNADAPNNSARTSDVSNTSLDTPTPASLEADLAHYKELFAKLRFSYVEQVTKEKFIRAIVGDPPLIVTPQENADLEASNFEAKAALKALKTEVACMVTELETRARDLAARWDRIQLETATLRELPAKMTQLEAAIANLKKQQPGMGLGEDGEQQQELNMPLAKTAALVDSRQMQLRELDRQLEQLTSQAPRKKKEVERLQAELAQLEARRVHSTTAAREAKRRREDAQGGVQDDLEAKGRWFQATEQVLVDVLDAKV